MSISAPDSFRLSPDRKRQLLAEARTLATNLHRNQVQRSELGLVLAVLFRIPGPWEQRRQEAERLLASLPSSGLADRSKTTRNKLHHLQTHIEPLVRGAPDAAELRFHLGWADRFLRIFEDEEEEGGRVVETSRSPNSRHG